MRCHVLIRMLPARHSLGLGRTVRVATARTLGRALPRRVWSCACFVSLLTTVPLILNIPYFSFCGFLFGTPLDGAAHPHKTRPAKDISVRLSKGSSTCKQHCSRWEHWTRSATPEAQNNDVRADVKTWRQAHEEAKQYERQLRDVMTNASSIIRTLDKLFTQDVSLAESRYTTPVPAPTPPPDPANMSDMEAFGLGELFVFQRGEAVFPDFEKKPPILAGELSTGKPIVGLYSSDTLLQLPSRMYRAQFIGGAAGDPTASDEENDLWRNAACLVADSVDDLYFEAEGLVLSVKAAEERAEQRRGPYVDGFRKRVMQQMIYATDGFNPPEVIDKWLTTLQTDSRLLRYLGLLEKASLEAEQLQAEIRRLQSEVQNLPPESSARYRAEGAVRGVYTRTRGLDVRIRACCNAAQDMPETMDAYKKLGEEWDKINPFKFLR